MARVFAADHGHEGFYGLFPGVAAHGGFTAQAAFEPPTEGGFFSGGNRRIVEEIIGIRIEKAISQDGRGKANRKTQQKLEPVHDPGVAHGLVNLFPGKGGVKGAGFAVKFTRSVDHRRIGDQVEGFVRKVVHLFHDAPQTFEEFLCVETSYFTFLAQFPETVGVS